MFTNEHKFVKKLKASDPESFKVLFDHYYPKLFNFLKSFIRNQAEIENLVQDVFLSIWEHRESLNESLSFSSYLYKTARNKMINHLRHEVNSRYYIDYCEIFAGKEDLSTEISIDDNDRRAMLEHLISNMPNRRKEIFLCSYRDGLSYREIAEKLQISENTVDTQIRNALQYLKNLVKQKF